MAKYFVDTEHIRGEPRLYWVSERVEGNGVLKDGVRSASDVTTSKRKAQRECDRLNREAATQR